MILYLYGFPAHARAATEFISDTQWSKTPMVQHTNGKSMETPAGTQVTITATTFTGATRVTFGGVKAAVFSVDNDTQVTAGFCPARTPARSKSRRHN
jgi:hypothetical protein